MAATMVESLTEMLEVEAYKCKDCGALVIDGAPWNYDNRMLHANFHQKLLQKGEWSADRLDEYFTHAGKLEFDN